MQNHLKRQAARLKTFVVDKILGVHDSPHRIALGVAIGIFVAWTPTIGFQMALALALSTLFRANKVVGVPLVWISNPATLWIYIPNYILGCRLLGVTPTTDRLLAALVKAFGINESGLKERFLTVVQTLWDVLAPLMLGSVIIGAALGALCYAATYKGVKVFQARRAARAEASAEGSAEDAANGACVDQSAAERSVPCLQSPVAEDDAAVDGERGEIPAQTPAVPTPETEPSGHSAAP